MVKVLYRTKENPGTGTKLLPLIYPVFRVLRAMAQPH